MEHGWTTKDLESLEREFAAGMTVQQVLSAFSRKGETLSEATFRKYVQLGLLPRSVRVGRKGKHRGSKGLYPPTVVRQLDSIRRLMLQGFTIAEIQSEFIPLRADIDQLHQQLERVFSDVTRAMQSRPTAATDEFVGKALKETRVLGEELISKLRGIEHRLAVHVRMARAAV